MIVVADRVREYTASTGVGMVALGGAEQGFRPFSAVCVPADQIYYCLAHRSADEWEVGLGTYSSGTITRNQILESSTGSIVDFTAGGKDIFITQPGKILDVTTRSPGLTILGRSSATDGPISRLSVADVKAMLNITLGDIQGALSLASDNRAINNSGIFVPEVTIDLVAIYNAAKA